MARKIQEYIAYPLVLIIILTFWLSPVKAFKHIIKVDNNSFTPAVLNNVGVGDTIRWIWSSGSHTTFSTTQSIPSSAVIWNSSINSSTTSFEYKVHTPGIYKYACAFHGSIASDGTTTGMSGSFTVLNATGIQEAGTLTNFFTIYPRPATDVLTVRMNSLTVAKGQIIVYDIQGNEVHKEDADLTPGTNAIHFSVSGLNKGQYFIEVYSDKKRLGIQKILKD